MYKLQTPIALALLCAFTLPAFAIDSSDVPSANRLFVAGSTSTDEPLYAFLLLASGGPCQPGTADVYIDTSAGPGAIAANANDQFLLACRGDAGTTFAGLQILVAKESLGGSANGTVNVARKIALPFLDPDGPACSGPIIAVPAAGSTQSYTLHMGCSGTISHVPDAGLADVDPRTLPTATAADLALLSIRPLFQVLFAPAVSLNLYRALQLAQGLPQNDDPANVPNLTRGQLEAIFRRRTHRLDRIF